MQTQTQVDRLGETQAALAAARARQRAAADAVESFKRGKLPARLRSEADAELAAATREMAALAEKEHTLNEAAGAIAGLLARREEVAQVMVQAGDEMVGSVIAWHRAYGKYLLADAEARRVEDAINGKRWTLGEAPGGFAPLPEAFVRPQMTVYTALESYFDHVKRGAASYQGKPLLDTLAAMERDMREEMERRHEERGKAAAR